MDERLSDDGLPETVWYAHEGGVMPVLAGAFVVIRYRCGVESTVEAGKRRWEAWPKDVGPGEWDIVAWRVANESDM